MNNIVKEMKTESTIAVDKFTNGETNVEIFSLYISAALFIQPSDTQGDIVLVLVDGCTPILLWGPGNDVAINKEFVDNRFSGRERADVYRAMSEMTGQGLETIAINMTSEEFNSHMEKVAISLQLEILECLMGLRKRSGVKRMVLYSNTASS